MWNKKKAKPVRGNPPHPLQIEEFLGERFDEEFNPLKREALHELLNYTKMVEQVSVYRKDRIYCLRVAFEVRRLLAFGYRNHPDFAPGWDPRKPPGYGTSIASVKRPPENPTS